MSGADVEMQDIGRGEGRRGRHHHLMQNTEEKRRGSRVEEEGRSTTTTFYNLYEKRGLSCPGPELVPGLVKFKFLASLTPRLHAPIRVHVQVRVWLRVRVGYQLKVSIWELQLLLATQFNIWVRVKG